MFIDGRRCPALDESVYERHSPFDGRLVATYPDAGPDDVELAIRAGRTAFDDGRWRLLPVVERAAVLRRAAELLRAQSAAFTTTLTDELGQPRQAGAVREAAQSLEFYAEAACDRREEAVSEQRPDALGLIAREPVGLVGVLSAWNAPLSVLHKVGPALAVGCTTVVKPAHLTAGAVLMLARVLQEAGLPDGVLNVVTSARENGAIAGQAIAASPLVDMVSFTGSSATGREVMAAASATLKKVVLELGGKSPNIIFPDVADLDVAVAAAFTGVAQLSGQACKAGSRLLLHESIHDEVIDRLRLHFARQRLGDPADPQTTMGPLVSRAQLERVERLVTQGRRDARMLIGGERSRDQKLAGGWFYLPTLIDQVAPASALGQTEVFGPVLSVMSFRDEKDALAIANGTIYGLAAAVWTSNIDRAVLFAKRLRAGTVWVNAYRDAGLRYMPSEGWNQSGHGIERSREALEEFTKTKSVHVKLRQTFDL